MAASVVSNKVLSSAGGELINQIQLSGLTAGAPETLSHKGAAGTAVSGISMEIITPPTDNSLVGFSFTVQSAAQKTAGTQVVKFDCPPGGSLDGAVVRLRLVFLEQASGGLNPP